MKRSSKKAKNGKTRLNIRLPMELDVWAKNYADKNNTNVTKLIVDHFMALKEQEKVHA